MSEVSYDDFRRMKKEIRRSELIKDFIIKSLEDRPYTCQELIDNGWKEDMFKLPVDEAMISTALFQLKDEGAIEVRIDDDKEKYYGLTNKINK